MLLYLHGADTFRALQRIASFEVKFRADYDTSGLNIARIDAQKADISEVEVAVSTPPFLAEKRLVILSSLLDNKKISSATKELLRLFEKVAANDSVIAVVWQEKGGKKKAKTGELEKFFKNQKHVEEYAPLTLSQIPDWITQEVSRRGGAIDAPAVAMLANMIGADLWRLSSEIDKLLAYSTGESINQAAVSELVVGELSDAIFELTDAIGNRDRKKALQLVSQQLALGMHPTELVSKIAWHTRTLGSVVSLIEQEATTSHHDVAKKSGLHPFVSKKALAKARSFSDSDISRLYQRLFDIDYRLKHGEQHPELLFDLLVLTV